MTEVGVGITHLGLFLGTVAKDIDLVSGQKKGRCHTEKWDIPTVAKIPLSTLPP